MKHHDDRVLIVLYEKKRNIERFGKKDKEHLFK